MYNGHMCWFLLLPLSLSLILFFSQERVEFAMPDIVVDLVTKNRGGLNHEVLIIFCASFLDVIYCTVWLAVLVLHSIHVHTQLLVLIPDIVQFVLNCLRMFCPDFHLYMYMQWYNDYTLLSLLPPFLLSLPLSLSSLSPPSPQRIIIGLRAFLMIADSLEKKEGDPPMPPALNSSSLLGSITRTKTKFLTNTLTEKIAKEIGIASYYPL